MNVLTLVSSSVVFNVVEALIPEDASELLVEGGSDPELLSLIFVLSFLVSTNRS